MMIIIAIKILVKINYYYSLGTVLRPFNELFHFMKSLNKYLLTIYYMPDTEPGNRMQQ